MDWDSIKELLPHYVALIVILTVLLTGLQLYWPGGEPSIWIQIGVAVVLGRAYPMAVRYAGFAPSAWE
jgi:cytochrome b subunit of formate dehydrogenase